MVFLHPVAEMVERLLKLSRPHLNPIRQVFVIGFASVPVLPMRRVQPAHFHEQIQRADTAAAIQNGFGSLHHAGMQLALELAGHDKMKQATA